jgi:hypothetical protein
VKVKQKTYLMNKIVFTLTLILLSPIFAIPTIAIDLSLPQQPESQHHEHTYEYADGAGNLYIINARSIYYRPIRTEQSSSLNYDGGKLRIVKIDTRQYQEMAALLDRFLKFRSVQSNYASVGRAKGTGLISKQDKNRRIWSRVISMNSQEQKEIEASLQQLIDGKN